MVYRYTPSRILPFPVKQKSLWTDRLCVDHQEPKPIQEVAGEQKSNDGQTDGNERFGNDARVGANEKASIEGSRSDSLRALRGATARSLEQEAPSRDGVEVDARPEKRALITGITGQDGSYLAELLLAKGYQVHGIIRRSSSFNTERLNHLYEDPHDKDARLFLHYGDLTDSSGIRAVLEATRPHEVYNLGAQSHVKISFAQPEYTAEVVAAGTIRLLEAVRDMQQHTGSQVRVYQAGSSEMFGCAEPPQSETTPFHPRSPYAVAKAAAHWIAVNYREAYGMFVANGILFNHESPRRGETFVTRKITRAAGRIREGLQSKLYLGNLDARRDWGFAGDYVEAMWRMLQQKEAADYVVATGKAYSVREFLEKTFSYLGLNYRDHVEVDARYYRPAEVDHLCGDASKARRELGWEPATDFEDLVCMMAEHDWALARRERLVAAAVDPSGFGASTAGELRESAKFDLRHREIESRSPRSTSAADTLFPIQAVGS